MSKTNRVLKYFEIGRAMPDHMVGPCLIAMVCVCVCACACACACACVCVCVCVCVYVYVSRCITQCQAMPDRVVLCMLFPEPFWLKHRRGITCSILVFASMIKAAAKAKITDDKGKANAERPGFDFSGTCTVGLCLTFAC